MAKSLFQEFSKGIIKENPVLRLMLGTCATLAVTTAASNAIGIDIRIAFVLVCSNAVISALRKVIPDKVRIPAYITVIAAFVTIVQLLIQAYSPALDKSLGIFLPLIVVNCIILGRAEMYANKNKVLPSIVDGLGMGVGFTVALLMMGIIRELLGAGTVFGIPITADSCRRLSSLSCLPEDSSCLVCSLRWQTASPKARARSLPSWAVLPARWLLPAPSSWHRKRTAIERRANKPC